MQVVMLKGPPGCGKTYWAGEQKNAIVVTRWHMHNITSAAAYASVTRKDIIFDVSWSQEREDFLRNYFKERAVMNVIEFTIARFHKEHIMDREEQGKKIAAILVDARKNGDEDTGILIAAALEEAMDKQGKTPDYFVQGRPGSWEADFVIKMAQMGGHAGATYVAMLVPLLIEIGEARENGGEILSIAVSEAIDTMRGFMPLIEGSVWFWELAGLGKQYSKEMPDDPFVAPKN